MPATQKQSIIKNNTLTSGRNFLQSLHEKQSIEIELSPKVNDNEDGI